jgi:hypothetical protein
MTELNREFPHLRSKMGDKLLTLEKTYKVGNNASIGTLEKKKGFDAIISRIMERTSLWESLKIFSQQELNKDLDEALIDSWRPREISWPVSPSANTIFWH